MTGRHCHAIQDPAAATKRDVPSGCVSETDVAAETPRQSPLQRTTQSPPGVSVCPPFSMCLFVFPRACALSLCEGRKSGPEQAEVSLHVFLVRACSKTTTTPAPNCNNSGSSFVSVGFSPGSYLQQRANPVLTVGRAYFPSY